MVFVFYDDTKDKPEVYGSLRAIANNINGIEEKDLYKHFSIPINNKEVKKDSSLKKKYHNKYIIERYKIFKLPIIRNKKE